jgi:hypothetical protein
MVRLLVRAHMFIFRLQRPLQNRDQYKGMQSHVMQDDEEDLLKSKVIWFLLNPRTSKIYQTWILLMNFIFWIDVIITPIIVIWPQYLVELNPVLYFCDAFWFMHICVNLITIRLDLETRDPLDIAFKYLARMFIIDAIATYPTLFSNHDPNFTILRILHVLTIG